MIRAVLDTNVVVSALLFSGPPSRLISPWQSGRLRLVVSAPILDEYIRVLAYPKFKLTNTEIRGLLEEELIPFIESATAVPTNLPDLRAPDGAKAMTRAVAAGVRWLVSGDDDLLSLQRVQSVEILSVTTFLQQLKRKPSIG